MFLGTNETPWPLTRGHLKDLQEGLTGLLLSDRVQQFCQPLQRCSLNWHVERMQQAVDCGMQGCEADRT